MDCFATSGLAEGVSGGGALDWLCGAAEPAGVLGSLGSGLEAVAAPDGSEVGPSGVGEDTAPPDGVGDGLLEVGVPAGSAVGV